MITDLEADRLADEYQNATPERKPQIETALRTWVTAAEAEAADRAREGAARLRQSFKSVSDLGGLWTKEQELRLPPTDNPDEVKARVANTAFLAEAGGMDYDTAAKTYEGLRARWAQATLGKKDAGDLEMYAEVSRQYQDGEDKAKLAFQRDADAASRGFQRALEGAPPDWSTPEFEWRKGAEKAPGFDASWGFGLEQSVAYRDAFQRAFKVATEHRPLVLETLDTLKRGTKWINQGAGLSEEAAARLMELPDAERSDVLRAIVAGAASMSPEDPGAAVSNLQKVFKNMGISASRGLDALRLSKVSQALSAADAASALEAIKDGKPVYDLGGGKIATSLAAVQGAFGLEVSMQAADPVPASEIPALTKKLEGTLKFFQITNQLEQVARQYLDPIRPAYKTGPGWVAETMAVGLAGSAPQMVAGAIPGVGLPWMTASFVDSAYERIVADQPDIDPRSALAMATVAGTIEGGIEMLQIRNAVGLLPATSKLVQAIRTPNVKLFKALGIQLGANIAEQNLEEALQDLALPTVKAIGAALDKDIDGVNWAQEWQEFGGTRLETFLSVLPLAILGAGAAGIRETTAFRNLLASEQALVEYGLPREVAAAIASQETPEARQAVFFEEQSKRTPESIRAGIAEAEARVARETVAATSNETPTMVYEGGKFRIVEPDGSSSMAFDDPETASLALQSRNEWEESGAAVAVRELADWLGLRDSDKRKWEVVPKIVTLEDDKLATPEQIAERMQLAGLEGIAPSEAQVFGQNVTEVRDGMVRVVNSVFIDSNPFDVIEEEVHFRFRQEMDAGIITREEAEAAVRAFQGDRAPQTFSDQALDEAVAEMGRAYFGGNFRFIQNMPQSVRSFFLRMAKFFRETFRNAAKLKKLIRDGKIDANWVAFLNRSVGLTEAVQEQEAAVRAAQDLTGQPAEIVTRFSIGARQVSPETPDIRFSVGRKAAPYAEQLAAQMDALKTKPAVRIQIYERAKKKFRELVERNRAAIAESQAADTRKPAEIIEEAKATHDAEVARIDAERDAAIASATTDKQRNTARLVHGTKLRAANMALSKALAAATGEGTRQARTAQVVGELNAILSAFPAEVRGRVGGFVQLVQRKTEKAFGKILSERIAKAEAELEKLLRKEYRAQLDRVLDSYRPQREAGKKPKGKIGAQAQEILDAAEAAMIMDASEVAALVAKYDLLANDPDASQEDVIKNGTIRDILPLLGDIKNADSARLVSAIDAVKLVGSEGWARWKFQQLQLKEDREIARKGLVQDTGKTGVRAERIEAEKNAVSVAGKSLTALLNLSSFSQVVDYLFGTESKFGAEFKKREMEASNQLEDKMDALNTAISDLFTEMAGGVVDGERLHYKLSQRSIKTDQGEFSELEALTAVLMWMQEDGKRHMIGKLDENGQPAGAWHYNQDFVDALTKSLSPEAVKVMDWLRKQYDAEHAELNPLYQKRHGVSLPKHENYSPISANPQQTKLGQTVDPVSGAPVSGSILTPGSLRSRSLTAVAEPNFRDALKVFLAHKRSMEHWAAYYDLAVDAQAILAHRDVTNAVEAKAGPEGKTVLTGWLNYFAQGGVREAAASLSINKFLSRMLGRASVMALFGRASTIMVQSTQLGASSVKMPLGAYVLRLSKLMSGQLGWGDAIKSEFIQRRIKQAPAIVQQAMQALGDAGKPNLIKHAARQVGKLITGADALFTAGTYAILLDFHKGNAAELNLTGQEADRFAHDQAAQDTEAVAQPTRAANRSLAELTATHPMARLGWSFASEARQKIALTAWAVQGRDAAQVSKTMILTFIVGGLFTQILKNLWREMKGDDDEEKWSAKRLAIASVTGPLNGIPGFNALTGDGGTLFSKLKQTGRAVESLLDGDQSAAQVVQGMNTLLSAMGLFSDNAAALSVMGNVATDAAKLLQNVSGEKTSSK